MIEPPAQWCPPSQRRPWWPWLTAVAMAAFAVGTFVFAIWVTSDEAPAPHPVTPIDFTDTRTALHVAATVCGTGTLRDAGHTLTIADAPGLRCVLVELGAPPTVLGQLAAIPLDDSQPARWAHFRMSWKSGTNTAVEAVITQAP